MRDPAAIEGEAVVMHAAVYLCDRHATHNAMELSRKDWGDYAAVRGLIALQEMLRWFGSGRGVPPQPQQNTFAAPATKLRQRRKKTP